MTNEQLAALDAAATQAWIKWWNSVSTGANDKHMQTAFLAGFDAGQLVVRTEPSEADVDRVARAVIAAGYNPATAFEIARAAIAAMVR